MSAEIEGDARLLWAAAWAVSDEAARSYLNGVYVEPQNDGGALIVATDGRKLICCFDETAKVGGPAIIGLSKRRAGGGRKLPFPDTAIWKHPTRFRFDGVRLPLHRVIAGEVDAAPTAIAAEREIDADFPDFPRVIPRAFADPGGAFGSAPGGAKAFADIRARFNQVHPGGSRARLGAFIPCAPADGAPAAWELSPCGRVLGVLMPVRGASYAEMPQWHARFERRGAA